MNEKEKQYVRSLQQTLREVANRVKDLTQEIAALKHQEPVAVIGLGCRFPGGANSPELFWNLLENGVDATCEIPEDRWDADKFYDSTPKTPGKSYTKRGGFLDVDVTTFDTTFFEISPLEAETLDPQQRLLLEVSWEALENAGLHPGKLRGSRTGIFIGMIDTEYQGLLFLNPLKQINAYTTTGVVPNIACGRLSYFYDFHGPCIAVDTACSSSLVSLHFALESLRNRSCDLALAGGVQVMLAPEAFISLSKLNVLSPEGRCKSFGDSADGYGRGEGCGFVVLKRFSEALRDGDKILAIVKGSEVSHNGRSNGLTAPNSIAQEHLIRSVLERAGMSPDEIDYVEAHATATSLGDPIEVQALTNVFKEKTQKLLIGAVKSNIGHLESGAGISSFLKVVLALQHGKIPPSLHCEELNPRIEWAQIPIEVVKELIPWPKNHKPRTAGVSSFGVGGTIAHVILQEPPDIQRKPEAAPQPFHILSLSAKTEQALFQLARQYQELLAQPYVSVEDICYTSNSGQTHFEQRLAIVGSSKEDFLEKLAHSLESDNTSLALSSDNSRARNRQIVFMFSGQGSQYPGMGRELYETSPIFKNALQHCDQLFSTYLDHSLIALLYGKEADQDILNQTQYTQPVIFAVEYALLKLWEAYGVQPALVVGHSIGAYTAAYAAGILTLEDAVALVAERGRLMQSLPKGGAMAVLFTDEQHVSSLLADVTEKSVTIAAVNSPQNVTISGRKSAVDRIAQKATQIGITARTLPVSHAFHSALMTPILEQFAEYASYVSFSVPTLPFISEMTGQKVVDTALSLPEYWSDHIRQPVQFYKALQTIESEGYQIFLEIGGTSGLTKLTQQCVTKQPAVFFSSLQRTTNAWQSLLTSLAGLYLQGIDIDWKALSQVPVRPFHILSLSAKKKDTLLKLARQYQEFFQQTHESVKDSCYTSNISRTAFKHRLAIVGSSHEEFRIKLSHCSEPDKASLYLSTEEGIGKNQKIVFMFTGQGSQYPGMGRELYEAAPVFKTELERCDKLFNEYLKQSIIEVLYSGSTSEDMLQQPLYAQPIIFSIEYALSKLWESYGIRPALLIGHSIGEYVAAHLAGVFSFKDAVKLVAMRGQLMQSVPENGKMVGILTDEETARALIGKYQDRVSIAAVNGPENITISGEEEAVEHVLKKVKQARIFVERLNISHAFHSILMEPLVEQFRQRIEGLSFNPPLLPIISTRGGKPFALTDPNYWSTHLCEAVLFHDSIKRAEEQGYHIYLEIGGTATLAGLAIECVADKNALFLPSLRPGNNAWEQLLTTLATLYLHGIDIDWEAFNRPYHGKKVWLPTYPFERRRYWKKLEGRSPDATRDLGARLSELPSEDEEALVSGNISEETSLIERTPEAIKAELKDIIYRVSRIIPSDIEDEKEFFSQGIDSLMLIQMRYAINEKYGINFPLNEFVLNLTTVNKLSRYIYATMEQTAPDESGTEKELEEYPSVFPDRDNRYEPFPLTEVQLAYLLGRDRYFEMGGVGTHYYGEFETKLDMTRLNSAFQKVIERHPMLRAVIIDEGRQRILEELPQYEIPIEDISYLNADEQQQRFLQERRERSHHVFPTGQWPMFAWKAFKLSEDTHYLMVNFDFLITDGASLQIMGNELMQWYQNPDLELPELSFSFRDYVLAYKELRNSAIYTRDKEYWKNKLADFPIPPAIPLKCHPSEIAVPHFKRFEKSFSREEWATLRQIAQQHAITPSALLCTAYSSVLSYWSNQAELALDLTVFNRYPVHEDVQKIMGDFTSIMILDLRFKSDEIFWQRAKRVQNVMFEALEHRHYDGVEFIRDLAHYRNLGGRSVVPFIFTSMLISGPDGGALDITEQIGDLKMSVSQTPQVFIDHQAGEAQGRLVLTWDVVEDLFEPEVIQAMFDQYIDLLRKILEDPSQNVLDMLTVDHKNRAFIAQYNNTAESIPATLLHQLFIEQARVTPQGLAVQDGKDTLTYKALDEMSNQVARCLQQKYGVGRNNFVGILTARSMNTIVYVMGILKSGAAYVPIDPDYPEERKEYIRSNSNCKLLLKPDFYTSEGIADYPTEAVDIINQPEDIAYIIYTSGSTGRPKGVVITHGAVTNTIQDINSKFQVNAQDALIAISSMCFDLSVYDVFGALSTGARLVVVKDQRDFQQLIDTVQKAGITIWNSVPAIMDKAIDQLANFDAEALHDEMTTENESDAVYYWNPVVNWEKQGDEIRIGDFSYSGVAGDLFPELYFLTQDGLIFHEIFRKFSHVDAKNLHTFVNELIDRRVLVNSFLTPEELFTPQNRLFTNHYTDEIIYIAEKYNAFKKKQLTRTYPVCNQPKVKLIEPEGFPAFISERRSYRNFQKHPVSYQIFSKFLSLLKQTQVDDDVRYFYPSINGVYPIDIFVYVKEGRIENISEGVYYYHPVDNALHLLNQGKEFPPEVQFANNRPIFESSAFTLFMIYNGETARPGDEGASYKAACIETGIIVGALSQAAELLGLGLCSIGAINFGRIRERFEVNKNQILLHTIEGGLKGDLKADTIESHIRVDRPLEDVDIHIEVAPEEKYWWAPGVYWKYHNQAVFIKGRPYIGLALSVFPELYFLAQHGLILSHLPKHFPHVNTDELNDLIDALIRHNVLVNHILIPEQVWSSHTQLTNTRQEEDRKQSDDEAIFIHEQITRTYKQYHHTPKLMFGDRTHFPSCIKNKQICTTVHSGKKLPFSVFSTLLATFRQMRKDHTIYYCYASAGGLYPIDIFVHVTQERVEGLEGGLYYYNPIEHGLHFVGAMDAGVKASSDNASIFSVYYVYNAEVSLPKYGGMGYFYAHIDTGIMIELLNEVGEFLGVGLRPINTINLEQLTTACQLNANQVLIQAIEVGIKDESALEQCCFNITEPMLDEEDNYIQYYQGEKRARKNDRLRLVLLSGDWIPVTLPDKIKHYFPHAEVISLGGATEASIWSIYYPIVDVCKDWASIPYGMPLANQEFYVLDYADQLCPVGVEGELYIGGVGVAQEYMNDEEKTKNAFITHPQLGKLYKTGDYGVLKKEGYIEFHGRKDYQVKVRGYRIELGEIEAVFREHVAIKDVVVIAKELHPGDTRLIMYFVSHSLVYWDTMEDYFETHYRFCRRREIRVKYGVPCAVSLPDGRRFVTMTEDISYNGIGLQISQGLLKQGDRACLSFMLPQRGQIEVEAVVIYVSEATTKGLRFEISSKKKMEIKNAVDHLIELYEVIVIDYRRGEYRIPLEAPCIIRTEEEDVVEVYTEDISCSGIGLKDVPDMYKSGDHLRLSFHLPTKELTIKGILQWIDQGYAGVKFNDDEESGVRNFVERHITSKGLTIRKLRSYVQKKLPDYMVPSLFVQLEELPLSANGKVDRKALPDPTELRQQPERDYVAPKTRMEKLLVDLFKDMLGVEKVGVKDNFFELGASSVHMIEGVNKLREHLQRDIPVMVFFEHSTIQTVAHYLTREERQKAVIHEPQSSLKKRRGRDRTKLKQRKARTKRA